MFNWIAFLMEIQINATSFHEMMIILHSIDNKKKKSNLAHFSSVPPAWSSHSPLIVGAIENQNRWPYVPTLNSVFVRSIRIFPSFPESPLISFENNRKAHGEIHLAHTHPHPPKITESPLQDLIYYNLFFASHCQPKSRRQPLRSPVEPKKCNTTQD